MVIIYVLIKPQIYKLFINYHNVYGIILHYSLLLPENLIPLQHHSHSLL